MDNSLSQLFTTSVVKFKSGSQHCSADYYLPHNKGSHPVIILAHGLGGVRTMRLGAYAQRFAQKGYACLVFDYRHFGDSEGQPRQLLDIKKQLEDWQSAIDYVHTLPEIEHRKIVLWGTSFGGGHVLAAAAKDHRVAAVISQCPFTNGLSSSLAVDPLTSVKILARSIQDRIGALLNAQPVMVPIAAKPGETGLMTSLDSYIGYTRLQPPGNEPPNFVAARFALDIIRYYPGRQAKKIKAPVLFCLCEPDSVAPSKPAMKYAAQAPKGEVKLYQDGHFDIYLGDAFDRVVSDQLEFLSRYVPSRRATDM